MALYQWYGINSLDIKFVQTAVMIVLISQKPSRLNRCDLNVNVHDFELPMGKSRKVLYIIMN